MLSWSARPGINLILLVNILSIKIAALSSSRSPSMRRMRQLLDLDAVRTGAPSPVPTPSGTLPRGQRQLDINPAGTLFSAIFIHTTH